MNQLLLLLVGAYLVHYNNNNNNSSSSSSINESDLINWKSFKTAHSRSYESNEVELLRRSVFMSNKRFVDQFNERQKIQEEPETFSVALNHLADISQVEIKARNGFLSDKDNHSRDNNEFAEQFLQSIYKNNSIEVPDEVDWRKVEGRVTRVKNQGSCGSCWAFSSTGVLEGQERVRNSMTRTTIELSEQNLVDCVKKDYGCNGGTMKDALEFIQQEGGIDDEGSYPYEGRTKKCRFNKNKVAFSDKGAALLPMGDEQKLKEVVAKFGPVAVAIDASSIWFQFYRHGVYYNRRCHNKEDQLDHAVLVVGYGNDKKGGDYWIVKNSWGPKYGEGGYIRMARNRNNNCGIATMATIPIF